MKNAYTHYGLKAIYAIAIAFLFFIIPALHAQPVAIDKVRTDFKALVQRTAVAPNAYLQSVSNDSLLIEKGFFYSEATEKVPLLIYRPAGSNGKKLPVVICLHGTGGSKDDTGIINLLYRFCKEGFMAVAIDGRYHGERAKNSSGTSAYTAAIIAAWENKDKSQQAHPFFFDTVYDVWKLVDYLVTRPDVEPSRIGMMGVSKGGIETWMAASVDTRIKVAVPVIATQSFKWSLENNRWQGRAGTIRAAHEQVAKDLGDSAVNKENVKALWDKLLPGITAEFDCPSMIRLFAPRPLLLLSTELDQNCPLPGAQIAFDAAASTYKLQNAPDKLKVDVEPNQPHRFTDRHMEMTIAWFKKWL
jgi:dienelactone hydrolase